MQLHAGVPGKAVEDSPCVWVLALSWEAQMRLLFPGFILVPIVAVWEVNHWMKDIVSL